MLTIVSASVSVVVCVYCTNTVTRARYCTPEYDILGLQAESEWASPRPRLSHIHVLGCTHAHTHTHINNNNTNKHMYTFQSGGSWAPNPRAGNILSLRRKPWQQIGALVKPFIYFFIQIQHAGFRQQRKSFYLVHKEKKHRAGGKME